ncbi:hypothetical protein ACIA5C_47825 [Actinoplanes sp. NPDC051343]|uniref:hypothetical protein n=1 Tax=Actinoplanes sp. NPDC051343 TaxID=3363906 RepID=UPI003793D62E
MDALINGAGGGVGTFAVQLAHQAGANVTATASPRSVNRIRAHGADRIIDYRVAPVAEASLVDDGGTFVTATTPGPDDPAAVFTASG